MYPRILPIMAAAVVLVLCRAPAHQSAAKIIRDGKDGPLNPAVEAGGHPLPFGGNGNGPPVVISYSLVSAIWPDNRWFPPCIVWPWRIVSPFPIFLHNVPGRISRTPRGVGIWVPPRAP